MGKQNKGGSRFTEKRSAWAGLSGSVTGYFSVGADAQASESTSARPHRGRSQSERGGRTARPAPEIPVASQPDRFGARAPDDAVASATRLCQSLPSQASEVVLSNKERRQLRKQSSVNIAANAASCRAVAASRRRRRCQTSDSVRELDTSGEAAGSGDNDESQDPVNVFRRIQKIVPETITIGTLLGPPSPDSLLESGFGLAGLPPTRRLAVNTNRRPTADPIPASLASSACEISALSAQLASAAISSPASSESQRADQGVEKARRKAQFRAIRAQFEDFSDNYIMV